MQDSDHHVIAVLDQADIANSDIMNPNLYTDRKRSSQYDGFSIDINVSKFIRKYKMDPPKLVKNPSAEYYKVQEKFMERGFEELKDWLKSQVQWHFKQVKQQEYHNIKCDLETNPVYVENLDLYSVSGDQILSFKDISEDFRAIIISLDGQFRGIHNTLKPKDLIKRRILNEKQVRKIFDSCKNEFSNSTI